MAGINWLGNCDEFLAQENTKQNSPLLDIFFFSFRFSSNTLCVCFFNKINIVIFFGFYMSGEMFVYLKCIYLHKTINVTVYMNRFKYFPVAKIFKKTKE